MASKTTYGRLFTCATVFGILALGAADAGAALSSVKKPSSADESDHAAIFARVFGGRFGGAAGLRAAGAAAGPVAGDGAYTNGSTTLTRVDDDADQVFAGKGRVTARALARFAGYQQTLGYLDGTAGGSFKSLFTVDGTGFDVSGWAQVDMNGNAFRFARGGGGETYSSLAADNAGADHMTTYKVGAAAGVEKWLLFFEDAPAFDSDFDYNDLAVEVTFAPSVSAIPLPPAVWSGLTVLLGGGLLTSLKSGLIRRWFS